MENLIRQLEYIQVMEQSDELSLVSLFSTK